MLHCTIFHRQKICQMEINAKDQIQRELQRNKHFQVGFETLIVSDSEYFVFLEHMSQLLLTYFKQLHGQQSFSEILFRIPLLNDGKLHLHDILQKDTNVFETNTQFRER